MAMDFYRLIGENSQLLYDNEELREENESMKQEIEEWIAVRDNLLKQRDDERAKSYGLEKKLAEVIYLDDIARRLQECEADINNNAVYVGKSLAEHDLELERLQENSDRIGAELEALKNKFAKGFTITCDGKTLLEKIDEQQKGTIHEQFLKEVCAKPSSRAFRGVHGE